MKTNCLDNDNVGTAHTTMGYVGNTATMSGTAATNLWGALARNVACHSTKIGYARQLRYVHPRRLEQQDALVKTKAGAPRTGPRNINKK